MSRSGCWLGCLSAPAARRAFWSCLTQQRWRTKRRRAQQRRPSPALSPPFRESPMLRHDWRIAACFGTASWLDRLGVACTCLFAPYLPTCLPLCLPACLPICLPAYLPACLPAHPCLPACVPAYFTAYPPALPVSSRIHPQTYSGLPGQGLMCTLCQRAFLGPLAGATAPRGVTLAGMQK